MIRPGPLLSRSWALVKEAVLCFIEDNALSRGASIAFYMVTSIAPVLIIVIAIAGTAFGDAAAQGAITSDLSGLIGSQSAQLLQSVVESASGRFSGVVATTLGLATLLVTASGVFGEMQAALNAIWRVPPQRTTVLNYLKSRAASLGLVSALGFLVLVSLVVSGVLSAVGSYLDFYHPLEHFLLTTANEVISFLLTAVLFAAIYKILPDTRLEWGDVLMGGVSSAVLFEIGKSLIALYIASSTLVSSYGAATGLFVLLLWIYYSAEIFLLGAEFTKAYATTRGSKNADGTAPRSPAASGR